MKAFFVIIVSMMSSIALGQQAPSEVIPFGAVSVSTQALQTELGRSFDVTDLAITGVSNDFVGGALNIVIPTRLIEMSFTSNGSTFRVACQVTVANPQAQVASVWGCHGPGSVIEDRDLPLAPLAATAR